MLILDDKHFFCLLFIQIEKKSDILEFSITVFVIKKTKLKPF